MRKIISRLSQSIYVLEKAFRYIDYPSILQVYEASLSYPIQEMLHDDIFTSIIKNISISKDAKNHN
jgi:hypothetical protein